MDIGRTQATEILLVEDDRDIREALLEVLEEEGYAVSLARTGVEAIQKLMRPQQLPAVILLDLMIPIMDGWEFWSVQQSNAKWASIPVVAISADSNAGDKARSLGALAFLRKPIDINDLLTILDQQTGPHRTLE